MSNVRGLRSGGKFSFPELYATSQLLGSTSQFRSANSHTRIRLDNEPDWSGVDLAATGAVTIWRRILRSLGLVTHCSNSMHVTPLLLDKQKRQASNYGEKRQADSQTCPQPRAGAAATPTATAIATLTASQGLVLC
jgi:hypothetical protein